MEKNIDILWTEKLQQIMLSGENVGPRGQECRELIAQRYVYDPKDCILKNKLRDLNYTFMLAEASWILSGRNDYEYMHNYLKAYGNYSDDKITFNGAYGPKVMDQVSYVAQVIAGDMETRRAYLNIWRERPGYSVDIPCTTGIQFFVRDYKLHAVVTMRSQDIVWGFPYDAFTFTCILKYVQLILWHAHDIGVDLGEIHVNVGSFHIYKNHQPTVVDWCVSANKVSKDYDSVAKRFQTVIETSSKPSEFVDGLCAAAAMMRDNSEMRVKK